MLTNKQFLFLVLMILVCLAFSVYSFITDELLITCIMIVVVLILELSVLLLESVSGIMKGLEDEKTQFEKEIEKFKA